MKKLPPKERKFPKIYTNAEFSAETGILGISKVLVNKSSIIGMIVFL